MSLYTLRTNHSEGLPFIITKFDDSLDVESSYPVGQTACECPAGHLPKCRHRTMLPTLRLRCDTAWFYDFDLKSWSDPTGEANKPATADEDQTAMANEGTKLHQTIETIHDLYQTGDDDAPDAIKDRNGEVVLGLCRRCGKGESLLIEPCVDEGSLSNEVSIAPQAEGHPPELSIATFIELPEDANVAEEFSKLLHPTAELAPKPAPAFKRRL